MATGVFDSCDWRKDGTHCTHRSCRSAARKFWSKYVYAERVLLKPSILVGFSTSEMLVFSTLDLPWTTTELPLTLPAILDQSCISWRHRSATGCWRESPSHLKNTYDTSFLCESKLCMSMTTYKARPHLKPMIAIEDPEASIKP